MTSRRPGPLPAARKRSSNLGGAGLRRAGEWGDGIGYASAAADRRRPGSGSPHTGAGSADPGSVRNGVGRKANRLARGAERARHGPVRPDPRTPVSHPRLSKSQTSLRASRPAAAYFRWRSWNFRWPQSALRIRDAHCPAFGLPWAGVGQNAARLMRLGLQAGPCGLRTRSSALCVRARSVAARPYPVAAGYQRAMRGIRTFALASKRIAVGARGADRKSRRGRAARLRSSCCPRRPGLAVDQGGRIAVRSGRRAPKMSRPRRAGRDRRTEHRPKSGFDSQVGRRLPKSRDAGLRLRGRGHGDCDEA